MLLCGAAIASAQTGADQITTLLRTTGAVTRTQTAKNYDILNAADFGAVCDGTTDNNGAFTKLAAAVNATSTIYEIRMPAGGTCKYSGGLTLQNQFVLDLSGAVLNYTGSAHAMDIGPTGLNATTAWNYLTYVIKNGSFTGGASMTQGLYFNAYITQPRVINVHFWNFGNTTAYGLYFYSQNWDILIDQCRFTGTPSSSGANWIMVAGTGDSGQSRLRVTHALGTQQASAGGVGIYTTGFNSEISDSKIEGFTPNIQVGGGNSFGTVISNVYMEATLNAAKGCIIYGDASGNWNQNLIVKHTYCNVHNTDFGTSNAFLYPALATTGLQYAQIEGNFINGKTAGAAMIAQNNVASQTGNYAWNNTSGGSLVDVLHTAGGSIANWSGMGGDEVDFFNPLDATEYIVLKAGKTANQYEGITAEDRSGNVLGQFEMGSDSRWHLVVNGNSALYTNTDGSVQFGGAINVPGGTTTTAPNSGSGALFVNGVTGQTADPLQVAVPPGGNVFSVSAAGVVRSGGSTGATTTVTCGAGTHISGITVVGGIVTAVGACN